MNWKRHKLLLVYVARSVLRHGVNFTEVVQNGKFYCPASLHYNKEPQQVNIVCDRCRRAALKCSIGYMNVDLCMKCIDIVAEQLPPVDTYHTFMMQSQFHQPPTSDSSPTESLTRMIQCQFTVPWQKTKMCARVYNVKK